MLCLFSPLHRQHSTVPLIHFIKYNKKRRLPHLVLKLLKFNIVELIRTIDEIFIIVNKYIVSEILIFRFSKTNKIFKLMLYLIFLFSHV